MRLTLERSGGFAGLRRPPLVIDTAQLGNAAAKRIESLVAATGFFELPAHIAGSGLQADRFEYRLDIVSDDGRRHELTVTEDALSEALRALVDALERCPRPR